MKENDKTDSVSEIEMMKTTLEEHAQRLDNVEKGQKSMNDKLERIDDKQDRVFDKLDGHTDSIHELRTNLPEMLMTSVNENAKRTQEIVNNHQVICTNSMEKKFITMPEGWKGNLVRVIIIGLALLFGLDASTLFIGKESEAKSTQSVGIMLKDQSGNVYKLIQEHSDKK